MDDVRFEIDRLDRVIVPLLVERATYVAQAAHIKPRRDLVLDRPRIEDVVEKARAHAARAGGDPDLVEHIYRAMVDIYISDEDARFVRRVAPQPDAGSGD